MSTQPEKRKRAGVPASVSVLRRADVCEALAVSMWTLDRWIRQGLFPRPLYMTPASSVAVWRLRDIENFLDKRCRARRVKQLRGDMKKQRHHV